MSKNPMKANWVRPVMKQMGLLKAEPNAADSVESRFELEESKVVDHIRDSVTDINFEAGRQILEMTEFLPPSAIIARIRFSGCDCDRFFEIVLDESGPRVVFYSVKRSSPGFARILSGWAHLHSTTIILNLPIQTSDTSIENIRSWMIYLISSFDRAFKPSASNVNDRIEGNCETVFSAIQS